METLWPFYTVADSKCTRLFTGENGFVHRQSQYGAYNSQAESAQKKRDVRMRHARNCNKEAQRLFAAAVSSPAIPCLTKCMTGDLHGML
jgi:hypothetical protein